MFFELRPSYLPGWRVFAPRGFGAVHGHLQNASMRKGADKTETLHGIECRGYEFCSLEDATDAIKGAMAAYNERGRLS